MKSRQLEEDPNLANMLGKGTTLSISIAVVSYILRGHHTTIPYIIDELQVVVETLTGPLYYLDGPASYIQMGLHSIHTTTGLPWWLTIIVRELIILIFDSDLSSNCFGCMAYQYAFKTLSRAPL
jgi:hypothetical protein